MKTLHHCVHCELLEGIAIEHSMCYKHGRITLYNHPCSMSNNAVCLHTERIITMKESMYHIEQCE